jgi:hypothetical protein
MLRDKVEWLKNMRGVGKRQLSQWLVDKNRKNQELMAGMSPETKKEFINADAIATDKLMMAVSTSGKGKIIAGKYNRLRGKDAEALEQYKKDMAEWLE